MSTSIVQHSWALALVSIAGRIEGITRLHKYAFLIAQQNKKIVDEVGFYNDWEPSHYGPFSKCLAKDIYELENKGLIKNTPTENEYGYYNIFIQGRHAICHLFNG